MRNKRGWGILACTLLFCTTALTGMYGGEKTSIKGFVTGRTDDGVTLRMMDGTTKTVSINDQTKVEMEPTTLGSNNQEGSLTELIPGLHVDVEGNTDEQGRVVADEIRFVDQDLETASMIQAGITPAAKQVESNKGAITANQAGIAANKQQIETNERNTDERFAALADYDVKQDLAINYASGASTLAQKDKTALRNLATNAAKNPHFLIQVQGFADSSGNPAVNQTLSKERAQGVVQFLMQECHVAPRHIVSPGAMGISHPVASNESTTGRAQNRRVEVKVLVNKALASGK